MNKSPFLTRLFFFEALPLADRLAAEGRLSQIGPEAIRCDDSANYQRH
ncbi:MAG: hypothetical protein M0036_04785 [Desulfobacteraceae bacterium]|nr:hypothetical protein [Desulfobacteraceae bacterium]